MADRLPVVGVVYIVNADCPQDPPIPARVVSLPNGTLCWAWSAHDDPAIAPLDRFPNARKLRRGDDLTEIEP